MHHRPMPARSGCRQRRGRSSPRAARPRCVASQHPGQNEWPAPDDALRPGPATDSATFAQATSRTRTIEPIRTHKTLPTLPTTTLRLERAEIGREPHFFKNADAESLRGGEAAQDHGKEPRHICAGLFHGDSGLEAGKRALTEVAEFGFIAIPLERQEERDIRLIEKVESLGAERR